jgi:hypothetical protein
MLNATTCATPSSGIADLIPTDRYQPAVARQRDGGRAFGNGRRPRNNRLLDAPFASQPSRLATLPAFSSGSRAFPLAREYEQSRATRLYSPHMPIHRIFAQAPFGRVHRGKKLRMICIRWRHRPLIPAHSLFSFQTITFSPFPFGPHPAFGCLAVKRNIVSAHGIAFAQPPEQPSEPHAMHSILQGHPGHDRRGFIRAQASSGQLWLKNRLGDHPPGCAQLEPSPRLVAISRSTLWRRVTPSAMVFCDRTRRQVDRTGPRQRKGHHGNR